MDEGRYRLELRDEPTGPDDTLPWLWKLYGARHWEEVAKGYERSRDEAIAAAKRWILFRRAQESMAPTEPETVVLDENGDPIPQSLAVAS